MMKTVCAEALVVFVVVFLTLSGTQVSGESPFGAHEADNLINTKTKRYSDVASPSVLDSANMSVDSVNTTHAVNCYPKNNTVITQTGTDIFCDTIQKLKLEILMFMKGQFTLGGLVLLVCSVGLILNVLSAVVLVQPSLRRNNVSLYLLALAIFDILFLFVILLHIVLALLGDSGRHLSNALKKYAINRIFLTGSVYVTIVMSVDRCIAVRLPLLWQNVVTRAKVKITLLAVTLWSIIINLPFIYMKANGNGNSFAAVFMKFIFPTFHTIIPITVLFVSNALLIVHVVYWNKRLKRRGSSQRSRERTSRSTNRMTVQIVCISILTLITRCTFTVSAVAPIDKDISSTLQAAGPVPATLLEVNEVAFEHIKTLNDEYLSKQTLGKLTRLLGLYEYVNNQYGLALFAMLITCMNSSTNFFFYCFFNSKFRRLYIKMFCRCCCSVPPPSSPSTTATPTTGADTQIQLQYLK